VAGIHAKILWECVTIFVIAWISLNNIERKLFFVFQSNQACAFTLINARAVPSPTQALQPMMMTSHLDEMIGGRPIVEIYHHEDGTVLRAGTVVRMISQELEND
jgi:hypothetical protein